MLAAAPASDRMQVWAQLDEPAAPDLTQALAVRGLDRDKIDTLAAVERQMAAGLEKLNAAVEQRLTVKARRENAVAALDKAHFRFLEKIAPLADDAYFNVVVRSEHLTLDGRTAVPEPIGGDVDALRILLGLRAEGSLAVGLLSEATGLQDASSLEPLRERYVAAVGHIDELLAELSETAKASGIGVAVEALVAFGRDESGIFALRTGRVGQDAARSVRSGTTGCSPPASNRVAHGSVTAAQSASDAAALRSAEAIRIGKLLLPIITALGIVRRRDPCAIRPELRIVRPIENITAAMTGLAAGNTGIAIPGRDRHDEVGRMAEALAVFRDTAVEIEEKNLREVATARERLIDAIESISDGFALWDRDDRLVMFNTRSQEILNLPDLFVLGVRFEDLIRPLLNRDHYNPAIGDLSAWFERRMALHRNAPTVHEQNPAHGTWARRIGESIAPGKAGRSPPDRHHDAQTARGRSSPISVRRSEVAATRRWRRAAQIELPRQHEPAGCGRRSVIIGLTELMRDNAARFGTEGPRTAAPGAAAPGGTYLNWINDILDLSKIEAGKLDLTLETVAIRPIVEEVLGTARPLAEQNKNALELDCADGIGSVYADNMRLRQILLNLLSNACKFTKGGTVRLSVTRTEEDGQDWVDFALSDTGIGRQQQHLGRQEFAQADASITRQFGGTARPRSVAGCAG